MKVFQSPGFKRTVKKVDPTIKKLLDKAIKEIVKDPSKGKLKKGDLAGVQVHKFKHKAQQYLLAYYIRTADDSITLLAFGVHENFYKDLKRK